MANRPTHNLVIVEEFGEDGKNFHRVGKAWLKQKTNEETGELETTAFIKITPGVSISGDVNLMPIKLKAEKADD